MVLALFTVYVKPPENNFQVSQREIIRRGLKNRCPNCGAKSLFDHGLTMNRSCSSCGMEFERDEGFFLGAAVINYTVAVFAALLPVFILFLMGILSVKAAAAIGMVGAVIFPILFYRASRSWWLMSYFYFLPHELPANRKGVPPYEDRF